MNAAKHSAPTHEELVARMEALARELGVTNQTLDALVQRRKRQRSSAGFPFNLMEWVLRKGLEQLERAVTRLVYRIGRR